MTAEQGSEGESTEERRSRRREAGNERPSSSDRDGPVPILEELFRGGDDESGSAPRDR